MGVIEKSIALTSKDGEGNQLLFLPYTKVDNVEGAVDEAQLQNYVTNKELDGKGYLDTITADDKYLAKTGKAESANNADVSASVVNKYTNISNDGSASFASGVFSIADDGITTLKNTLNINNANDENMVSISNAGAIIVKQGGSINCNGAVNVKNGSINVFSATQTGAITCKNAENKTIMSLANTGRLTTYGGSNITATNADGTAKATQTVAYNSITETLEDLIANEVENAQNKCISRVQPTKVTLTSQKKIDDAWVNTMVASIGVTTSSITAYNDDKTVASQFSLGATVNTIKAGLVSIQENATSGDIVLTADKDKQGEVNINGTNFSVSNGAITAKTINGVTMEDTADGFMIDGVAVTKPITKYPAYYYDRGAGTSDWNPTQDATITGKVQYKNINIPEGVTITVDHYARILCTGNFVNNGVITAKGTAKDSIGGYYGARGGNSGRVLPNYSSVMPGNSTSVPANAGHELSHGLFGFENGFPGGAIDFDKAAGGGTIIIACSSFENNGSIIADGSDGADGTKERPRAGGGGGGGSVKYFYSTLVNRGTITANGGKGGASLLVGGATGKTDGTNGSNGYILYVQV